MAEDPTFKVEKLTAENYHGWKFNMNMYLIGKDLWEIVTGTETVSDDATDAQKKTLAAISLFIAINLQIYVRSAETAKQT